MLGTALCSLPPVPSPIVEAHTWERVAAALLDPRHLTRGLATARAQFREADQRLQGHRESIDREVARLRAKLTRITSERLDVDAGSEAERVLLAIAAEAESTIARLLAERADLLAEPSPGVSEAESLALETFADEVRDGLDQAVSSERRRIYDLLRLRGIVREDPEHGLKMGRRHSFLVECQGVIELPHGGQEYKKTRLKFFTDEYAAWEAKYMLSAVG